MAAPEWLELRSITYSVPRISQVLAGKIVSFSRNNDANAIYWYK
jgi:hypothetical protein